jgi:hypothetical protein
LFPAESVANSAAAFTRLNNESGTISHPSLTSLLTACIGILVIAARTILAMKTRDVIMKTQEVTMKTREVIMKIRDVIMKTRDVIVKTRDVIVRIRLVTGAGRACPAAIFAPGFAG